MRSSLMSSWIDYPFGLYGGGGDQRQVINGFKGRICIGEKLCIFQKKEIGG
jgi:hypothetical protein